MTSFISKKLLDRWQVFLTGRFFLVFALNLLILSLGQVIWGISKLIQNWQLLDFTTYRQATLAFIQGQNPYLLTFAGASELKFIYPPGALLFFSPLISITPKIAEIGITLLSLLCFGGVVAYIYKYYWHRSELGWFLVCVALLLQTFPLKFTLAMGQINLIVLGLAFLSLWAERKGQPILAGSLLGIIATLKLFSLAFLPLFLIRKEWKLSASMVGIFIASNFWNLPLAKTFFLTILPKLLSGGSEYPSLYSQSVSATGLRLGLSPIAVSAMTLVLLITSYWGLILYLRKHILEQTLMIGWSLVILFSGNGWQHYFVLIYPMILVFFARSKTFLPIWFVLAVHFSGTEKILAWWPIIGSLDALLAIGLVGWLLLKSAFSQKRLGKFLFG